MSDGWIEWAGGECPVHPDTVVETEFRDGGRELPRSAFFWDWRHHSGNSRFEIVRYRIVRPPLDFHTSGASVGDVAATLDARERTHGTFADVSNTSCRLKEVLQADLQRVGKTVCTDQHEALSMICTKLARIVNGNADEVDHWHDIAGYAQLVADRLRKEQA